MSPLAEASTTSSVPLVTEAPFVGSTVNTLLAFLSSTLSLIVLPVFSRPSPTWVSATSTVTVCLPLPSVFADTVAPFLPTNSTSAAFFTAALNAVLFAPLSSVVLLDESTQPKSRKSPTVAAVVLATVVPAPVAGLVKSTNCFLASLPVVYLVKPLATLVICLSPALIPSLVTLIGVAVVPAAPVAGVMVKPSLVISVFAPLSAAVPPKVTLVKPVKVSFSE